MISKLGSLAMEGVGILDIRLGSSTEGGEERDRADTSLRTNVEVVESSATVGFNSSDGRPTLLTSPAP